MVSFELTTMTMRARARALALLGAALALGAGCSYGVFDDLADKAPATRITQDGEIASSNYGDSVVGLSRGEKDNGGVLAITGNADSAFSTAIFTGSGSVSVTHMDRDDLKDVFVDIPSKMHCLAAAPSTKAIGTYQGPFVYLGYTAGSVNKVLVVDSSTFKRVREYTPPSAPATVAEFGVAVAAADFGDGGTRDDLVVGAKDALVLKRARNSGSFEWPDMQDSGDVVVKGATDWPVGQFVVVTTGDLDEGATPEDEVVAAIPERNTVMVVHNVGSCFADPGNLCTSALKLPTPSGATEFGAALLIVDVDGDGKQELVVGAPGNDRVYVYDLGKDDFTAGKLPDPTSTIQAPTDAKSFGKALAFGRFDGSSTKSLLAVGAPNTASDGTAAAGRIYLYSSALTPVGQGTVLASPEENMLIGRRLTTLPLRVNSTTTYDVLVAGARSAVFVFFASLSDTHKDIRNR